MSTNQEHLQKSNIQQIFLYLLSEKEIPNNKIVQTGDNDITALEMSKEIKNDTPVGKNYISNVLREARDIVSRKDNNDQGLEKSQPNIETTTTINKEIIAIKNQFSQTSQAFIYKTLLSGVQFQNLYVHHINHEIYKISTIPAEGRSEAQQILSQSTLTNKEQDLEVIINIVNNLLSNAYPFEKIIEVLESVDTKKTNITLLVEHVSSLEQIEVNSIGKMLALVLSRSQNLLNQ